MAEPMEVLTRARERDRRALPLLLGGHLLFWAGVLWAFSLIAGPDDIRVALPALPSLLMPAGLLMLWLAQRRTGG